MSRKNIFKFILLSSLVFIINNLNGQVISGTIKNAHNLPLYLFYYYGDQKYLIDSTATDTSGNFSFDMPNIGVQYEVRLSKSSQYFYLLRDKDIRLKTVYNPHRIWNYAEDSMKILKSIENKKFYKFLNYQRNWMIGQYWLLQMLRVYPVIDPFHTTLEKEYNKRYSDLAKFMEKIKKDTKYNAHRIALAYYLPNPDWKMPDPWRDSVIVSHYFDYFDPSDPIYLHTFVLPEKMDIYLKLRTNIRDNYGQPIYDEFLFASAAINFIKHTEKNLAVRNFCISYYLNFFKDQQLEKAFVILYDTYLKNEEGDCGTQEDEWAWARKLADKYKGIELGKPAPDFLIPSNNVFMYELDADYILLVFWATWCSHCMQEIPDIYKATLDFPDSILTTVAISLDTVPQIVDYLIENFGLNDWIHYCEYRGWNSDIVKAYNVYATPTMFLLDRERKVVAKPISYNELSKVLIKLKRGEL
ncbi:MAG: TlpA disulfide reductase family protein [Bacteroidales bacterium]|jgi:thiol-disulfide isomerase/thioredoxin|nr:TlpA disulfide reductase family protein [Bacteroidota bacterium]MDY0400229.1 TlpA disulfide reductase family protein [Bacteroidales bacterium]HHW59661.1 AhpC/TSA family protein [Bacteroidales bacterium]